MLIDKVEVVFKAGSGGHGKVSFRRNNKGPDGGNGGRGGSVYVRAVNDIFLLNQFGQDAIVEANHGQPGGNNQKTGHAADDVIVNLPIGTSVIDKKTHSVVCELTKSEETILICKGGKGGKGNTEFKTAEETAPKFAEQGEKGQKLDAILSLKLIADFGLIGLPNAGKSSLLNELTNANAKVGNYQFTTLEPNLGVIKNKVIADIPGLIEGAADGKGLGIAFLKHIEKVGVLLHCISAESTDVLKDYETIRAELGKFNPKMLDKKEIILITKTDLVEEKVLQSLIKNLKSVGNPTLPVSIHDFESLEEIKRFL